MGWRIGEIKHAVIGYRNTLCTAAMSDPDDPVCIYISRQRICIAYISGLCNYAYSGTDGIGRDLIDQRICMSECGCRGPDGPGICIISVAHDHITVRGQVVPDMIIIFIPVAIPVGHDDQG